MSNPEQIQPADVEQLHALHDLSPEHDAEQAAEEVRGGIIAILIGLHSAPDVQPMDGAGARAVHFADGTRP